MRRMFVVLACALLAGCLTTTKAVLNEGNSVAAGDSAAFMAFVEAWEKSVAGDDGSPRELATKGERVLEIGAQVMVQERKDDGSADYYALAMVGARPVMCMVHHEGIDKIAERHGVTVDVEEQENAGPGTPASVTADGTEAALHGFVLEVFTSGPLVCQMPPVKAN